MVLLGIKWNKCWLLEMGRCPLSLKQQASSPALWMLVKSNKCLIHFKTPICSDRQGPVTAVAMHPFQWPKVTALGRMAGTMCRQALIVVATFMMSCQDYVVRLFLLLWRQGVARIHHQIISHWWQTLLQLSCPVPIISLEGCMSKNGDGSI